MINFYFAGQGFGVKIRKENENCSLNQGQALGPAPYKMPLQKVIFAGAEDRRQMSDD